MTSGTLQKRSWFIYPASLNSLLREKLWACPQLLHRLFYWPLVDNFIFFRYTLSVVRAREIGICGGEHI